MVKKIKTQIVVLGGGPAGYSAAFRSADLGMKTTLINKFSNLGGVCLNVGCIPSKALLHVAKVIENSSKVSECGVEFEKPNVDISKLRDWKNQVISKLQTGLDKMAKARKVETITGEGKFLDSNTIAIQTEGEDIEVNFENAIIAVGSHPILPPFAKKDDDRIWNSTDALKIPFIPSKLLVVGGGVIGLEMATVYSSLGSEITIAEFANQLVPPADKDVIKAYLKAIGNRFKIMLETKVISIEPQEEGLKVSFEGANSPEKDMLFDAALISIGRRPSGLLIDAQKAGVEVEDNGFIKTDDQMRTNVPHIYAIGDVEGNPMLAHKGAHQGHVAAEVISGEKIFFSPVVIPSIAYTDPEIAWVGLTEKEAKEQGIEYEVAVFPWAALGRAIASDCADGMTKLFFDKETKKLIGGAVVGENSGELLGEISLAIEMGADDMDMALTIHAHPSLYESIGLAAEMSAGTITDLPNKKVSK